MSSGLLIFAAAALLPLAVQAAEMPKEGTDNTTNIWLVTSSDMIKLGDRTVSTFELSGVTLNDNGHGMFDKMGLRCLGTVETVGKSYDLAGTCFRTDADGDSAVEVFESHTYGHGHSQLAGGTGKYAGIIGESEWVEYNAMHPIKALDKKERGLVTEKVRWKLP